MTIIERELPTVSSALAPGQTTDRYAWTPQLVRQAATAAADARTSDAVIDTVTPGNNGAVLSASRRAVANAVRAGSIHQINERISDAAIDVSTPANESTTIAPSRQAVAEAIDGITVGGTADGVADSVDLAISGQDLSITVGRTVGGDLTDTVTLPAGGGGTTVAANPAGTDGSDLTRISIGSTNYNIAGGGGGSGRTELYSQTDVVLAQNVGFTFAGINVPDSGHIEVFVWAQSGNRAWKYSSGTIPVAWIRAATAAQPITNPFGANREMDFYVADTTDYEFVIRLQNQTGIGGNFDIHIDHVTDGGGGGGGITEVTSDNTLTGLGTIADPLGVTNPATELTEEQAEDEVSTVFGTVSGERMHGAVRDYINDLPWDPNGVYEIGQLVTRAGIHWFSLVDDNQQAPNANNLEWFSLPGASTFRIGSATPQDYTPLTIVENFGIPYYTTIAATNVTRNDIPNHAAFEPLVHLVESIDTSLSGSDLTISLGRLDDTDLTSTVTLPAGGGGGEENVQADWTEATTTDDAYIQNKPTLGALAALDQINNFNQIGDEVIDQQHLADDAVTERAVNPGAVSFDKLSGTVRTHLNDNLHWVANNTNQVIVRRSPIGGPVEDYFIFTPNPTAAATVELEKMDILGTVYSFPTGGGGGVLDIDGLTEIDAISDTDTLAIYDVSESANRKVAALDLENTIRIHRGLFDADIQYRQGHVVETGDTTNKLFWIASTTISAMQPEPTLTDPHQWWLLATPNHFRGELDDNLSHNFISGDWFRIGDRFLITTADLTGVTGDDLLGGHANVVELTGDHNVQSDWDETDTTADEFIDNKPTIPSGNALVPTTGTTGHVLTKTAAGRAWQAAVSGFSQADADARYVRNIAVLVGLDENDVTDANSVAMWDPVGTENARMTMQNFADWMEVRLQLDASRTETGIFDSERLGARRG